jgi:glycosyltransferase involved in cell wall biosynthesis
MTETIATSDQRRCLAMICNTLTPYRVNLHKILAREIPELQLLTLVTHGKADFNWELEVPPEIHVTSFSKKGETSQGGMLVAPWTDWKKGAELIRFFEDRLSRNDTPFFLRNDANIHVEKQRKPWRRWIKRRFFNWASARAAGVMPMGELGEQYFAGYGFPMERMYRVPYTPDYDWFATRDDDAVERVRGKLGLVSDRRRLIYSGRLVPVKRVDLVIDAFANVTARRPDWDLVIVGTGPLEAELRQRATGLGDRVRWTGFLEVEDLRAVYHACDALVLASRREAWGVVVQEAMAAGLPVVASDVVGAAHDLIEDGVSGRIFKDGSLASLTDAILDMTDGEQLARRQTAARARLSAWRREVDVVANVRRALRDAGALPAAGKQR